MTTGHIIIVVVGVGWLVISIIGLAGFWLTKKERCL
jgi:hypothetical protein